GTEGPVAVGKSQTGGRGVDVVLEAAGSPAGFRIAVEAVRPGGEVVWLGKVDVEHEVAFRWGSLMAEKRLRRSSCGGARPARHLVLAADGGRRHRHARPPDLVFRRAAPEQ